MLTFEETMEMLGLTSDQLWEVVNKGDLFLLDMDCKFLKEDVLEYRYKSNRSFARQTLRFLTL